MYKQYPLTASPLFRVQSIHRLAQVLKIEVDHLLKFEESLKTAPGKHYRVFTQGPKNREIQHPFGAQISIIQKRLKKLFARLQPPAYLHSGRKGISYVDNAAQHLTGSFCMPMDIRKFYESTSGEVVFQFFFYKLEMASDLARLLTNLCTFQEPDSKRQKIPTGSTLSQLLAYWAYSDMFDRINDLATSAGALFTLYVDDMTFSSDQALPADFHKKVQEILATKGLRFKPSKLHRLFPNQAKSITGCTITSKHELVAPNQLKRKAVAAIQLALHSPEATAVMVQKAQGLVQSIRQIEPGTFTQSLLQLKAKQRLLARS